MVSGPRGEDVSIPAGTGTGVNWAATGWRGFEDVLKSVKGKTFDELQRGEEKAVRARNLLNGANEKKVTVVFFVGGRTFTEIATFRFVGRREEGKREIVICTTGIINGDRMMKAAMEK